MVRSLDEIIKVQKAYDLQTVKTDAVKFLHDLSRYEHKGISEYTRLVDALQIFIKHGV